MSDSAKYDPETYSSDRPGTNPQDFDEPHNAPKATEHPLPRWIWGVVAVSGVAFVVFLGVGIYLMRRRRRLRRMRAQPSAPIELEPIPHVHFPYYFPPGEASNKQSVASNERDSGYNSGVTTTPFDSLHPSVQDRVLRSVRERENSLSHVNPAFGRYRRQLEEQVHGHGGTTSDVVLRTDTSTIGPSTIMGPPGAYLPPAHLSRGRASSRFSAVQFPSPESDMTGYEETELSNDPWKSVVERNRRMR